MTRAAGCGASTQAEAEAAAITEVAEANMGPGTQIQPTGGNGTSTMSQAHARRPQCTLILTQREGAIGTSQLGWLETAGFGASEAAPGDGVGGGARAQTAVGKKATRAARDNDQER